MSKHSTARLTLGTIGGSILGLVIAASVLPGQAITGSPSPASAETPGIQTVSTSSSVKPLALRPGTAIDGKCIVFADVHTSYLTCVPDIGYYGGQISGVYDGGSARYTDGSQWDPELGNYR